ncbi:MAG: hypothetical protein WCY62_01065 [Clostridia bacterium]|jgi:hypothetical protein
MAERIIVSVVVLMLILCIFVSIVDVLALISKNLEFRDICRTYMIITEQDSGLSGSYRENLENDLLSCGFSDIVINIPYSIRYGSVFSFTVSAYYSINTITDLFVRSDEQHIMRYDQLLTARRIG